MNHYLFLKSLIIQEAKTKKISSVDDVRKITGRKYKLGQISLRFSREIRDSFRSTFKYSEVGLPSISKHLQVR